MNERRGGARYQVPNGREVDPTLAWAVLAVAHLAFAYAVRIVTALPRFL